jgi:Tol biopolymer transport system component
MKDLSTGEESRLGTKEEEESHPVISRNGTMIAYSHDPGDSVVPRTRPAAPEALCANCGWVWDWSPDDQTFLFNDGQPVWGIGSFNPKTGKKSTVLAGAKWPLYQARFSPDGKWLVFGEAVGYSTSRLFITPLHNGIAGREPEWIAIADTSGWCDKPRWSPDGGLIYFISHRDGYRCLWAQRVAQDTRRPLGEPFGVAHFHSARLSMMNVGTGFLEIDVAADKVVFNLDEVTGNIWLAGKG